MFNRNPIKIQIISFKGIFFKVRSHVRLSQTFSSGGFHCKCLAIVLMCCFDTLQWRHNERHGVSNHQPHDCLLNRLLKAQMWQVMFENLSLKCASKRYLLLLQHHHPHNHPTPTPLGPVLLGWLPHVPQNMHILYKRKIMLDCILIFIVTARFSPHTANSMKNNFDSRFTMRCQGRCVASHCILVEAVVHWDRDKMTAIL